MGPAARTPSRSLESDLIISWGANLDSTNVHLLPFVDKARQRGAPLIVIDVWRTRTARRADWFIPLRVGTDTALALGVAHVLCSVRVCSIAPISIAWCWASTAGLRRYCRAILLTS